MYLCTEGKILAHADVDMSLLLPSQEWQSRSTWEFGRTGLEGDFQLRIPGEPVSQHGNAPEAAPQRGYTPVVTIGAELCRADADSNPSNLVRSGGTGGSSAAAAGRSGAGAGADASKAVSTWSYLAPRRKRGIITAALQRLELKPTPSRGGRGAALSDGVEGVLVGITGVAVAAAGKLMSGTTRPRAAAGAAEDSFRVIGCGERGEIDTEDSELLQTITWRWEGEFPDLANTDADADADAGGMLGSAGSEEKASGESGGARGPLASIKVLTVSRGGRGDGHGHGHGHGGGEIATGLVPWPSSACSGRQYVNVTLLSPEGFQVGSCRVCLLLSFPATASAAAAAAAAATTPTTGTGIGVGDAEEGDGGGDTSFEPSFEQDSEQESEQESEGLLAGLEGDASQEETGGSRSAGRGGRHGERVSFGVRTAGVQAEEPPLERSRVAAGARGTVPRSYRMSINLASVKDLENAAYVVRGRC